MVDLFHGPCDARIEKLERELAVARAKNARLSRRLIMSDSSVCPRCDRGFAEASSHPENVSTDLCDACWFERQHDRLRKALEWYASDDEAGARAKQALD